MKFKLFFRSLLSAFLFLMASYQSSLMAQATCAAAVDLTTLVNCPTAGNLQNASNAAPTGTCGGATSTSTYGVWYEFTASNTTATITLSGKGANLAYNTTYIQVLNDGTCGSQTVFACQAAGTLAATATPFNLSGLTIGALYYIRVYVTTNPAGNGRGFTITLNQTPANDVCASAFPLTAATTCSTTTGTLSNATASVPTITSSCAGTPGGDVWYTFVAQAANATVTLSNKGTNFSSSYIQVLSGTCAAGGFTSLGCVNGTSLQVTNLTIGTTYYVRIYSTTTVPTGCSWEFDICVTYIPPPANDVSTGAVNLTPGITCTTTTGTLLGATASSPIVSSTCSGTPGADVWYSFTATSKYPTINLSSIGASLGTAPGTYIQLLSSSFASLACVNGTGTTLSLNTSTSGGPLTVGNIYYIRIYTQTTAPASGTWTFNICLQGSPNDECLTAVSLTSGTTCTTTAGNLLLATASSPIVSSTCSGTPGADVWYSFTANSKYPKINLSSIGVSLSTAGTAIQLFSGSCGSLISLGCNNGTGTSLSLNSYSINPSGLTVGATYYIRIYTPTAAPTSGTWTFNICVQDPPANDECTGAVTLTSGTTCTNTAGDLTLADPSNPAVASTCGTTGADVWYQFVAQASQVSISLSSVGASFTSAGTNIQLLSGACGSFTSLACVNNTSLTTSTLGVTLTVGTTYYVRVYTGNTAPTATGTWTYNICISEITARIDFSRSYINVTKGTTGGTVDVGDILEMRATFVVRSKTVDSLSFIDTLYNTKGLKLVPGSISWRTNEDILYGNRVAGALSPFTDAFDGDAGWWTKSTINPLDTVIHINFGSGATANNYKRGQLSSTSRPSFYNSTCIIMLTYRVQVYAPYNTLINFKTGALTYRDPGIDPAGTVNKVTFNKSQFIVYQSPGLCPNAVSVSNALGAEYNGTFGAPDSTAPLARNRGTTPYTSYTYTAFTPSGGPQDYYYGITNNTSGRYSALNTWLKPDPNDPDGNGPLSAYRIFSLWDITGDHTGAPNTAKGNSPCDTTLPISATNPCGYMLVINSSYKADTAFTYTVNNLCPNTYYEISGWFKNICSRCGCDSTGAGSGSAGYIPTAAGDSSGVRPNIAFDVNGADYYTTGDILYQGTSTGGLDVNNQWVKRGFTYLTGANQSSFTLTIRNNAPGGGGNDWALDDISVYTCLPNMKYSPTVNPVTCMDNVIQVQDTITSYFSNYNNYQWQRSTDGGTTWNDLVGQSGSVTPVAVTDGWRYITAYTIPPTATKAANNGDKYRVIVSTTAANLPNVNCQLTDGVSIINLTVLSNCTVLPTKILSFNGKLDNEHAVLFWTTSREEEHLKYAIEKSSNGIDYTRIGTVSSYAVTAEQNHYTFTDPTQLAGRAWYRIVMIDPKNRTLYSRSIVLDQESQPFAVTGVLNPFTNDILFDVAMNSDAKITAALYSISGTLIKQQSYTGYKGTNGLTMTNLKTLSKGMYLLQVQCNGQTIVKKVVRQ